MNAIDEFAELVREFCAWVEGAPASQRDDAMRGYQLMAALFAAGTRLPSNTFDENAPDEPRYSYPVEACRKRFAHLPFEIYWEIYDPLERPAIDQTPEPCAGDFPTDIGEIRDDVLRGLWHYDEGRRNAACWEWQESFTIHTGKHLVSAIAVLHSYLWYQ